MSSRTHHRRSKASNGEKQAFDNDEAPSKPSRSARTDAIHSASNVNDIDFDQFYEQAFFTFNKSTMEVILDKNILSWSKVSGESHSQPKPSIRANVDSIDLHYVYAVSPVYKRQGWLLAGEESQISTSTSDLSTLPSDSPLRGFQLYTYEAINDGTLHEVVILLQSNLPNQIQRWYHLLTKIIARYKPVRNILVICHPFAGSKNGRDVYQTKIGPMLDRAQCNVVYSEIDDSRSAAKIFDDFSDDFNALSGLVVIGGDGSVISVINALIRYLARENRTRLDREHDLPPLPFPLCIVPTGTTNLICHSIHGSVDYFTPILRLLFNHQMRIDMSAVFDVNHDFVTANFSTAAGYAANALRYFTRYPSHTPKKVVQKSFAKAAANKNLRPIDVQIRYLSANVDTTDLTRCCTSCPICTPTGNEGAPDQVQTFDETHVRKIDDKRNRFSSSNTHNSRQSISASKTKSNQPSTENEQWAVLRQDYLHVAVLTNASLWSMAPQGLSKFGHLADGYLDLILIEQTARKEFLRTIKRHGTSKNQFEFAFTKIVKVKEIEIELNYSDLQSPEEPISPTDQLDSPPSDDSSDDDYSTNKKKPLSNRSSEDPRSDKEVDKAQTNAARLSVSFRRKHIFHSLKLRDDKIRPPRPSSTSNDERIHRRQNKRSSGITLRPTKSFLSTLMGGSTSSRKSEPSPAGATNRGRSPVVHRLSCVEHEEEPIAVKNQSRNEKQPCMWNLDFTPYNWPLVRIKCFYRYLPVFGVGPHPDVLTREVHYSCFGRLG